MKNYITFLKKEFTESAKTYKLLIFICAFFSFGMMAPLVAKFTPDIVSSLMSDRMELITAEPSAYDAWAGFFKNTTQLALTITVIAFCGILSQETVKGTLINMLTKGLSRSTVILSKFSLMALMWTLSYALEFAVCYGYTMYLFPNDTVSNLYFSIFCVWIFGIFILSLLMMFAAIFKTNYSALLATSMFSVVLGVLNLLSNLHKFNPMMLVTDNTALLDDKIMAADFNIAVVITILCSIGCVIAAINIFKKRLI